MSVKGHLCHMLFLTNHIVPYAGMDPDFLRHDVISQKKRCDKGYTEVTLNIYVLDPTGKINQ